MSSYSKTVIVTGGTTGIGKEAALAVAKQKPDYLVIIASRTDRDKAANAINAELGQSNVVFRPLDLSSQKDVHRFAEEFKSAGHPPVAALLLNAALQVVDGLQYSPEGIEKTFSVTHLGHALLFYLLSANLDPKARIVITASGVHDPAQKAPIPNPIYVDAEKAAHPSQDAANKTASEGRRRYALSKLCNVLWTYALHKRIQAAGKQWTVNAFDPGLVPGTQLAREAGSFIVWVNTHILPHLMWLLKLLLRSNNVHTAKDSGGALARLGIGEDVAGVSGTYYEGRRQIKSSVDSHDVSKQEDLWSWTAKELGRTPEEKLHFASLT